MAQILTAKAHQFIYIIALLQIVNAVLVAIALQVNTITMWLLFVLLMMTSVSATAIWLANANHNGQERKPPDPDSVGKPTKKRHRHKESQEPPVITATTIFHSNRPGAVIISILGIGLVSLLLPFITIGLLGLFAVAGGFVGYIVGYHSHGMQQYYLRRWTATVGQQDTAAVEVNPEKIPLTAIPHRNRYKKPTLVIMQQTESQTNDSRPVG